MSIFQYLSQCVTTSLPLQFHNTASHILYKPSILYLKKSIPSPITATLTSPRFCKNGSLRLRFLANFIPDMYEKVYVRIHGRPKDSVNCSLDSVTTSPVWSSAVVYVQRS